VGAVAGLLEAKQSGAKTLTLWGSGTPSREFLYVEDCAEGILLAAEHYNKPEPVNLGVNKEIRIRELAELTQKIIGYEGKIVWDTSRTDGQPRRALDTARAEREFNFTAKTSLEDGLRRTIDWYLKSNPQ